MVLDDWNKALLALTLWREARGEGEVGMQAVGCVIRNRQQAKAYGNWAEVMCTKYQFSSLTAPEDPMLIIWPGSQDLIFPQAMQIAEGIYDGSLPDITEGAFHYFNPHVVMPGWAASLAFIKNIGRHAFYK